MLYTVHGAPCAREDVPSYAPCASLVWVIIWCLAVRIVDKAGARFSHAASLALLITISRTRAVVIATKASKKLERVASPVRSIRSSAAAPSANEDTANLVVLAVYLALLIPIFVDAVCVVEVSPRWARDALLVSMSM